MKQLGSSSLPVNAQLMTAPASRTLDAKFILSLTLYLYQLSQNQSIHPLQTYQQTINCNKYIMNSPEKLPQSYEESQDEVINQIKSIASEILQIPDAFTTFCMDLQIGKNNYDQTKKYGRLYSYTERNTDVCKEQCQSEWIDYQTVIHQIDKKKQANNQKEKQIIENIPKLVNKNQKVKLSPRKKTQMQNLHKITQPKSKIQSQKKKQQEIKPKVNKVKIKVQNIQQFGFMKPTGNIKAEIVEQAYKRKQLEEQSLKSSRKVMKTLQQIYQQKQPLYQKYLKDKQKKLNMINESRVTNIEQQTKYNKNKPDINNNIQVKGTFNQRQKNNIKKIQQNRSKVLNDILKETPFQPQINTNKKYNKVQSAVKRSLSEKYMSVNNSVSYSHKNENETDEDSIYIKNNNFFDDNIVIKSNRRNKIDCKINSTKQLANILQIDEYVQN